jgi:hypothetical protein
MWKIFAMNFGLLLMFFFPFDVSNGFSEKILFSLIDCFSFCQNIFGEQFGKELFGNSVFDKTHFGFHITLRGLRRLILKPSLKM